MINTAALTRHFKMTEMRWLLFSSILVGAAAGFTAYIFTNLIHFFYEVFFASQVSSTGGWQSYLVIVIPVVGGLIVGPLVTYLAPEAKGHGVPEVMYAVNRKEGKIRARVAVVKAIASAICIGSGGSVGKEGPIVQIGSAIGSGIAKLFRLPGELTKVLVACGAAGGIAATFGTPLAGILFSMEVILNDFAIRAFSAVVISAVTAIAVAGLSLGQEAFFQVPKYELVSYWELIFYSILGIFSALSARAFVKVLYSTEDFFDKLKVPSAIKPAIGGLGIGLLGFYLPQIFGTGHGVTEAALWGKLSAGMFLILFFAKICASSLTLGSGGSGGVFSPALFIGAMLGGSLGSLFHFLFPFITAAPGAYAMVGMAAFFAGATRAPITAIIILFEMTGDYRIMLPVMIACVISTLVSGALSKDTIYTLKLRRRGIDLEAEKAAGFLSQYHVRDVMSSPVETVTEGAHLDELLNRLEKSHHSGFPVINEKGELVGLVTHDEIYDALPHQDDLGDVVVVKDIMKTKLRKVHADDRLDTAVQKLRQSKSNCILVVNNQHEKRLEGIITHSDVLKAYQRAQSKLSEPYL